MKVNFPRENDRCKVKVPWAVKPLVLRAPAPTALFSQVENRSVKNWIKISKENTGRQTTKGELAVGSKTYKKCMPCGPAVPFMGIYVES